MSKIFFGILAGLVVGAAASWTFLKHHAADHDAEPKKEEPKEESHILRTNDQTFVKLDVQGYELQVLKGAVQTLAKCTHVYAECSEVALYDGQSLRPAITAFLGERGFRESGSYNHQWQEIIKRLNLYGQSANLSRIWKQLSLTLPDWKQ